MRQFLKFDKLLPQCGQLRNYGNAFQNIFGNFNFAGSPRKLTVRRSSSKVTNPKPKTAIVMMNMGGPQNLDQVADYLLGIMTDRDMIQLPVQGVLGPWIARRRTEEVKKKYSEIGGGSPILEWTERQGAMLCELLDGQSPETAPHRHYVAFRYVSPTSGDALERLRSDGVKNAVLFSQYPQYSCATSGSSYNVIADHYKNRSFPSDVRFSVIDRWPSHPLLAQVFSERIKEKLERFPDGVRDDVIILFSAHSLPLKAVARGDSYPHEVAATVARTLSALGRPNPHRLVWQSKVGPLPWLEPYTDDAIKAYVEKGKKNFIIVPIAFVNEHIETLHELDIEYCHELAAEVGATQIERAATPNDHPLFIEALADIVRTHLADGPRLTAQFLSRCPNCTNPRCETSKQWYQKICST